VAAQTPAPINIDSNGIMHWATNNAEVQGFGVNYTLPFAHEYRMAAKAGVNIEEAISQDVYHMARLDLDLYRVHVWDTEISDTLGNLIDNKHLQLLDFTLNEMKKRGMHFILTPIAYWGNGWPEPDEATPGFSYKYGKDNCLTNPAAIEAQTNYLFQFLNHVNPYTGIAYKDDPTIIGFEICNEPQHHELPEKVTAFINKMVASMRKTGCAKPIFYNVSQVYSLSDAYLSANIQGVTFQWYPTNLVANHQINGNFLPQVASYRIPFASDVKFKNKAKIVYEFDPADVGGSIMYPAMALTFRQSGMQLATQFAYDALCKANYNTNYGTHFMNLAYAPHKAISLKIASAVFHEVPLYKNYEDKTHFDSFRISYKDDLAEWLTNEKFFYTNTTTSAPVKNAKLKEIAGCGSSPLVKYTGTGAYFLDKLADGVWRLEVMPDAYWIEDPYSPVNPNIQKAAVLHANQLITINLDNLGDDFTAQAINAGNSLQVQVNQRSFKLMPGVYLLKRKGVTNKIDATSAFKNIKVGEFAAPASNFTKTQIWNTTAAEVVAGKPLTISFKAVSPMPVQKIQVVFTHGERWKTIEAAPQTLNSYLVDVPQDMLDNGFLDYRIMVIDTKDTTKFPGAKTGDPWKWGNRNDATYQVRLVPENSALMLWNAATDWNNSLTVWNPEVSLKPVSTGETALCLNMSQLPDVDPTGETERNYAFKFYFANKIKGRYNELINKHFVVIKAHNALQTAQPVELAFIDQNGSVYAASSELKPNELTLRIPLQSFANGTYLVIPRPFPVFLPYQSDYKNDKPFDWSSSETLQLMVKPGTQSAVNLEIEKIWLE
jgi:hypothetical protein